MPPGAKGLMLQESTSSNLILKPMGESHLACVMEIEQRSFPCPWSKGMFQSEFHKRPFSLSYVAEEQCSGEIVGYVLFSLMFEDLHILNLAVHPGCRRKGIGDSLIAFVLGIGRARQTEEVLLEVRASNAPALALYRKFGFREVGMRRNYYFKPTENALLLRFDLQKKAVSAEVNRPFMVCSEVPYVSQRGGFVMVEETQTIDQLREKNRRFRSLEKKHHELEASLHDLNRHKTLTAQEELQRKTYQKEKLAAKDTMTEMVRQYQATGKTDS